MAFRKAFAIMETTDSSRVYKLARRYLYTKCSFCRPHEGDNGHKYQRSWKKLRKTKYKGKELIYEP